MPCQTHLNLLAIVGWQGLVLVHTSVFKVLSVICPVQVQSLRMTLKARVLLLLASSELLYVKTLISPYGIKYAIWICYGCPDTFMVFHCFVPSLYGPCVPRSIFGGEGGLIDTESAGSQCSDFTPGCWLTRHRGLYLMRPGGRRWRMMSGPAGTHTEQAA